MSDEIFYKYSRRPWYCGSCKGDVTGYKKLYNSSISCERCNRPLTANSSTISQTFGLVELGTSSWYFKEDVSPVYVDSLKRILNNAYNQSAKGKGIERHGATGKTFDQQQIVSFGVTTKSINYNIGQANKKILEALNLPAAKAIHELLGAINYVAGAIAILEKLNPDVLEANSDLMKGGLYDK